MKNVEFTINGKTKMKGYYYRTFRVDVQPFLLVFRSQLISKGVRFV